MRGMRSRSATRQGDHDQRDASADGIESYAWITSTMRRTCKPGLCYSEFRNVTMRRQGLSGALGAEKINAIDPGTDLPSWPGLARGTWAGNDDGMIRIVGEPISSPPGIGFLEVGVLTVR
jgi:hypothetical protein